MKLIKEKQIDLLNSEKKLKTLLLLKKKEIERLNKIVDIQQNRIFGNQNLDKKVFCLGSNKTGTTSLDSAMKILGYKSISEDLSYQYLDRFSDINGEMKFNELMSNETINYNFFQDLPFNYNKNYMKIDEFYPNAKYILTLRDPENWFISCQRWIRTLDCKDIYSWIWSINFIYKNKKKIIELYNKRNNEIIEYYNKKQKNNLLVLNIENAEYENLCQFLNISDNYINGIIFPKENVNE